MSLYVEGDVPYIANGNCNNGGMFGNNGDWIWAFLLFALIGNGGWGFGGGNGGVGSNYVLATDFATIERKLDGVNAGLCDGFYAMNTGMLNGFAGVQQTLCQGFSGVNASITDVGYSIKDCCCQTQRAIDGVNYNIATQFGALNNTLCGLGRDIIDNQNANYRALHDEIVANKIEAKNDRIAEQQAYINKLELKASQSAQNAYLLNELKPCPSAAYIVPNPNCCYNYGVTGFGYGNGCCTSVQ
jgi:hypothetical protein